MADTPTMADLPSYAEASRRINAWLAHSKQDWAGVPMPIPDLVLTIEDRNPWKAKIEEVEKVCHESELKKQGVVRVCRSGDVNDGGDEWLVVNQWWSPRLGKNVAIVASVNPPLRYRFTTIDPRHDYVHRFEFALNTMRATIAWTIETETVAMEKLAELIKPHLWEGYVHTGMFLETSARSGLTYFFRRCRPTVVYNAQTQRILCGLCLHPIGYYQGTYAGSMCPTDDVIAHLMLMRGDEALLWRRANQHPPDRPEAGI